MINCVLNRFRVIYTLHIAHYGKSATIPESNHGSGVCKELCTKTLHFVSGNWRMEISSVACWLSSIKIDYSDYPKSLICRINEVLWGFFNKISP